MRVDLNFVVKDILSGKDIYSIYIYVIYSIYSKRFKVFFRQEEIDIKNDICICLFVYKNYRKDERN